MTPQRRTALVSIGAAGALVALKLGTGLASGSLGLVSEALHSGTDLIAALLTFFAIGVAVRPADEGHQYGHGKAEHLAALGEATVFLFMGPVILVGSYYVQTSNLSWPAFLISLPVGLLVTAILQANNIRDIADDTEAGKRTLATYIGRRWANREYIALLFGAYAVVLLIAAGGIVPAGVLVVFLTLPRAIELARIILQRDEARAMNAALRQTAGLHLQFGLLIAAVLFASVVFN